MSIKRLKVKKSFIITGIVYFILCSLIVIAVCLGTNAVINKRLNSAFPTIDNLLEYEDVMKREEYSKIPAGRFKHCEFIVYDDMGKTVYATSKKIRAKISSRDASLLNDYNNSNYYVIYNKKTDEGKMNYYVFLVTDDLDESYSSRIIDKCILDENYKVIEGHLFSDRGYLTKQEFGLLQGVFTNKDNIEKSSFVTDSGENRTVIMLSPDINENTYYRTINSIEMLWLLAIPIIIVVILFGAMIFARKIRKSFAPFNNAIESYKNDLDYEFDTDKLPRELEPTIDSFVELMTSFKNMQNEKDEMYQEKQRVIADLSHDLKTPLTVIQGYSGAFMEDRVPEEKRQQYLEAIYNKSKFATEMIDTLFEYTRIEHPNFSLNPSPTDICEFTKETLAEKYSDIEDNGFNIDVEIPDEKMTVSLDCKLMKRVFDNLINNALKYNPTGTTIFASVVEEKSSVILTIADNGIGIPEELNSRIFDVFVTENTARSSGNGTGLGLSIAKRIVELHGGSISLVTPPHEPYKTEFRITLPKNKTVK